MPGRPDCGAAIGTRSLSTPWASGVLPPNYTALRSETIASLLRHINSYTRDLEGDAFGLVYEYFLANFALAEGQGAGEFFTPAAIVRLRVVDRVLSQLLQR